MTEKKYKKNLSRFSLYSGAALAMAFSLLSVIVLLFWWQKLITRHLEAQYRYFATQLSPGSTVPDELLHLIRDQDERLAQALFADAKEAVVPESSQEIILTRLQNRKNMVLYERTFFILLLFSGHLFLVYIYFRERNRRKLTEETILLATHELRQPLQSLTLALETLKHDARGSSKTAISAGLGEINRLGEHIRWLAQAFAPKKNTRATTQIPNVALWLENFFSQEFSAREQKRLVLEAQPKAVRLCIGDELLRFVLRNLIENGLKYAQGQVKIMVTVDNTETRFTIANSTAQLDQDALSRMGTLFFRSRSPLVQNTPGFGLGLYLCGRVARRVGGKLILATKDGQLMVQFVIKSSLGL